MSSPEPPQLPDELLNQLPLTEEQQELIHRITGEYVYVLELVPDATDGSAGTGRGLRFNWRISVDSGIPRQQWTIGGPPKPPR